MTSKERKQLKQQMITAFVNEYGKGKLDKAIQLGLLKWDLKNRGK